MTRSPTNESALFDAKEARTRIVDFIATSVGPRQKLAIGLSGGVDSDVTARLVVQAVGSERLVPFLVLQEDQDPAHVSAARELAAELGVGLQEVDLGGADFELLKRCSRADVIAWSTDDTLLRGKAKNLLRSFVAGLLVEEGCRLVGAANRTEIETGFFLPLGDGLAHLLPIAHLYKSEVYVLAALMDTDIRVMRQPASAGYWVGESDLDDLAYWILLGHPPRSSREALALPEERVGARLDFEHLDAALRLLNDDLTDQGIASAIDWPAEIVCGLRSVVEHTAGRRTPLHSCLTVSAS